MAEPSYGPLRALLAGLLARRTRPLRDPDRRLDWRRFHAVSATSDEQRTAVFRLRYHIYVDLMGTFDRDDPRVEGSMFRDQFDEYSTLLVLLYEEQPVGTMRITSTSDGPLELERYRDLSQYRHAGQPACEFQRLMILPEYRCVGATRELFVTALRLALACGVRQLFGAARIGNLGRLFRNLGAQVLDPSPFRFSFLPNVEYQLIGADLGRPRTLRRWKIVALLNAWDYLARARPALALRMSRRAFSTRRFH